MKCVTIGQVIAWKPCSRYSEYRIGQLFNGRSCLTARDVAELDISQTDRLWALLHHEFLSDGQMHLAACDFADLLLPIWERKYPGNHYLRRMIENKRMWVNGKLSDELLIDAQVEAVRVIRDTNMMMATIARWVLSFEPVVSAYETAWECAKWRRLNGVRGCEAGYPEQMEILLRYAQS